MRPVVHDKRHALPQLGGDGHVWGLCGRILVMCSKVRTQGLGNLSKRRSTGVPWTWSGFLAVDPKFIPVRPRCGVDSSQVDKIRNLSSAPIERVLERFPLPPVFPAIAGAGRSRRVNPRDNSLPLRPLLFLWERAAHL